MPEQHRELNRRDFIKKSVIGVGAVAALSSPLPLLLNRVKAAENDSETSSTEEKVHAWCMVVDLKKCEGCVSIGAPPQCTQACIQGHFVPEGQQWIQVFQVGLPGGGTFFMPTPCQQCENAPCVNVCPVAATYHDKNGVVLIDHNRCIGCRFCMAACPYHRRFFNWGTPKLPPEAALAEYSPLYPVPAVKGTVIKCMFCAHMLKDGKLPLCVSGCPMKALYIGDLNQDIATNGKEVVMLSKFLDANDAYRFKDDLGTQPRVWYLPGHGQNLGRHADDAREFTQPNWPWGDGVPDPKPGVSIWKETDGWTWEAQAK